MYWRPVQKNKAINPATLNNDTICAIATASGKGAISMIRLSGKEAISICNGVFFPKDLEEQPSHTVHFGQIRNGEAILDEALATVYRAPGSYTGEDVVELSCHGSPYIQQSVLNLLIDHGARLAEPGEFTLRAFRNGKMDLSQAEAVADLIASGTRAAHKVAMQQMRGGFSEEIRQLREDLINFASLVELELDFSEEDVEFANRDKLAALVATLQQVIQRLVDSFEVGNVIKNGIPVVIAGKPNVGKSTLLNALLNEEKAIVSEIAGTTRDLIEDVIHINGIDFRFIDTAGIRDTTDEIEEIGVKRTLEKIKSAAVVLYLFDVHEVSSRELQSIRADLQAESRGSDARILLAGNKIDTEDLAYIKKEFSRIDNIIFISAREKQNLDQLTAALLNMVNIGEVDAGNTVISNIRHLEALKKAHESLTNVQGGLNSGITGDLLAIDIKAALHHLGEITGEVTTDDLLGNIFSRFCIGK